LAVLTLTAPAATDVQRYDIYSGSDEIGQIAQLVGFGFTGTGTTGYEIEDNLRRIGRNRLDSTFVGVFDSFPGWTAGANALLIDFDNGSGAQDALGLYGFPDRGTALDEVLPAPGDSGGPALLNGRIAGTASFATRVVTAAGSSPDIDEEPNRSFGEVSALTRISRYQDWISNNTVIIPEPGSGIVASIALAGILVAAWFRSPFCH
jgi:hypothetical protein